MEVSSHAIHQKRIAGLNFMGGIFTNITHEHLDYHKSFREYISVKKAFFDQLQEGAFVLVNRDDRNAQVMLQNTVAQRYTYGLKGPADYKGKVLESHLDGMQMMIGDKEVWIRLTGSFNASNILAVFGCGILCGMEEGEVLTILSRLSPVRGRFETLQSETGITAIVDYAHTPDALKNVLGTIARLSGGQSAVITVVGAGGDRDPGKRPLMGKVAAELSQKLILTSDNPRTEKAEDIISEMKEGIPEETRNSVLAIADRREAIKTAIMLAAAGDVILVAGKGHETYQEIGGERHHFDDMEVLRELLKKE
jgi:UDP-N-acetylmuramoyl-L-alanyl-D-glutamate--2,6-diaminopimelate ligase